MTHPLLHNFWKLIIASLLITFMISGCSRCSVDNRMTHAEEESSPIIPERSEKETSSEKNQKTNDSPSDENLKPSSIPHNDLNTNNFQNETPSPSSETGFDDYDEDEDIDDEELSELPDQNGTWPNQPEENWPPTQGEDDDDSSLNPDSEENTPEPDYDD